MDLYTPPSTIMMKNNKAIKKPSPSNRSYLPPPPGRLTRSANSSPMGSPTLSRKMIGAIDSKSVLQKPGLTQSHTDHTKYVQNDDISLNDNKKCCSSEEHDSNKRNSPLDYETESEDSLYKSNHGPAITLNDEQLIDVTSSSTSLLDVTRELIAVNKTKCPCTVSDTTSTKIICATCGQHWHQNCSNLKHLTPHCISKLTEWECPKCYTCPLVSEKSQADTLRETLDRVKNCNEELESNVSTVEFFNLHLKHLIIHKETFEKGTSSLEALTDSVESMKKDVKELKNIVYASDEDMSSRIYDFTGHCMPTSNQNAPTQSDQKITELESQITKLSAQLDSVLNDPTPTQKFATDNTLLSSIKENVSVLNTKLDNMERRINLGDISTTVTNRDVTKGNISPRNITYSPHAQSPKVKSSSEVCKPYEQYVQDAIPHTLKSKLLNFLDKHSSDFKSEGDVTNPRHVLYYGDYGYWYTGGQHQPGETPNIIRELYDTIKPLVPEGSSPNSCLINKYPTGKSTIGLHRDDESFIHVDSHIVCVSLGAKRTLKFVGNNELDTKKLLVDDRSLYTMTRFSQDFWCHGIEEESTEEVRYSFTFRRIAPHNANSTVLIGDSNSEKVNFGTEKGTLGPWIPGKRIKAIHIEDIPDATEIGPYRNVVLHTQ